MARRIAITIAALVLVSGIAAAALPHWPTDPLPGAGTDDPAEVGAWLAPFEGHVPAISMVLLKDGRVLYWGGVEAGDHDHVFFFGDPHVADSAVVDPATGEVTVLTPPEGMGDLFCAGQTILPDGTVLTAGGSEWRHLGEENTAFVDGEKDVWVFDPGTTHWVRQPDMGLKRWYPTLMTLGDGRALVASGIEHLPQPHTLQQKLEVFSAGAWSDLRGADNLLPMYPRLFTIPTGPMKGDVFYATVGTLYGPFGEHPLEGTWSLEQVLDLDTNTWTTLGPSVFGARQHAATVMLPLSPDDGYTARLLTFGGSIGRSVAATGLAEMTVLTPDGRVEHEVVAPLAHPRWHLNGVLLPDDSVLAIGGGMWDNVYAHGQRSAAVMVAERFDPATGEWRTLAPMSVPRTYHSTALLLPDGRVLVGGHVPLPVPWKAARDNAPWQDQVAETRFEVYEPPYLHWGVARPAIVDAPAAIAYGETFTVEVDDASALHGAVLVHPGATTHAWDVNQRSVVLERVGVDGNQVTFRAPPDGDVAMPGPWMLFVRSEVAGKGLLPSEAAWVSLG